MKQNTILHPDIMDEEFDMNNLHHTEIADLIEHSLDVYYEMSVGQPGRKKFRDKINELIDEYNERRDFNAFRNIK